MKRERSDGTSSKSNKKKAEPKAAPDLVRARTLSADHTRTMAMPHSFAQRARAAR